MTVAGIKKIIREIFSEPGQAGTLSWGRIASAIALVASIVWVSHILIRTHQLPSLTNITEFVVAPYASAKAASAAQAFTNNPVVPKPPEPK